MRLRLISYSRCFATRAKREDTKRPAGILPSLILILAALGCCLALVAPGLAANAGQEGQDLVLPQAGEEPEPKYSWAPQLLYAIISSQNPAALNLLYDAAFAAGPSIVPQLEAALGDDRTAEFAAQSLAFIGGKQAKAALAGLVRDPRDLDLSRFYYGALGEYDDPEDNQILLDVIRDANNEPDRTVTDAAIIALTVRSGNGLIAPLEQAEAKLTDPVIRDDLAEAISIIQERTRGLASQGARGGRSAGGSIEQAIHFYFLPAIEPPSSTRRGAAHNPQPDASIKVEHVELSPDKMRALARVTFEDSAAVAHYQMVLKKTGERWGLATVWLGSEEERPNSNSAG
jgi:hypothetical protein